MKAKYYSLMVGMSVLAVSTILVNGCASNKGTACDSGCCKPEQASATKPASAPVAAPVKVSLKLVKVDSEETTGENGGGANAVDGDNNTFWHTQWEGAPCPHEIVIELNPPATIKGFTYLPRQDENDHGNIKDYEIYASNDTNNFGQPIAKGSFEAGSELKTVSFPPTKCQFVKLKALSEVNGEIWSSAAEVGVVQTN